MKWHRIALILFVGAATAFAGKLGLKDFKGIFSFQMAAVSAAGGAAQAGVGQTVLRIGAMKSDGKGAVIGQSVSTLDDGTNVVVVQYNWTGTYTVNTNGIGQLLINAPTASNIVACTDGNGTPLADCEQAISAESFAFVIVSGRKGTQISLMQTDAPSTTPRQYLQGIATTQEPKGSGGGGGGFWIF